MCDHGRFVVAVGWDRRVNVYIDSVEDMRQVQEPQPHWPDDIVKRCITGRNVKCVWIGPSDDLLVIDDFSVWAKRSEWFAPLCYFLDRSDLGQVVSNWNYADCSVHMERNVTRDPDIWSD